jgi:hypothetical protein
VLCTKPTKGNRNVTGYRRVPISRKSLNLPELCYATLSLKRNSLSGSKPSPVHKTSETIHNSHPTTEPDRETQLSSRQEGGSLCKQQWLLMFLRISLAHPYPPHGRCRCLMVFHVALIGGAMRRSPSTLCSRAEDKSMRDRNKDKNAHSPNNLSLVV